MFRQEALAIAAGGRLQVVVQVAVAQVAKVDKLDTGITRKKG